MRRGDAFGAALLAGHAGRDSGHLVERDDGYVNWMTADFYFGGVRRWRAHEKAVIGLARGRVLDVGCGAGRHALYLQGRGCRVTAIDVSPGAVRVARARGVRDVRLMSVADIGRFHPGTFDTVIMFGNNFGVFGSRSRAVRLLKAMRRVTSPRARLLVSCNDPYRTGDSLHLRYHARNRARGRMGGQIRIRVRYRDLADGWFDYLFVSPAEMRVILREAGWRIERLVRSGGPRFPAYAAAITGKR